MTVLVVFFLQSLGRVDKIAFDKTGTLTEGRFSLRNLIVTACDFGNKEVMEYLTLMEAPSSHPLASALVDASRKEVIVAPKNIVVRNHTVLKGEGLFADIEGKIDMLENMRQTLGELILACKKHKRTEGCPILGAIEGEKRRCHESIRTRKAERR